MQILGDPAHSQLPQGMLFICGERACGDICGDRVFSKENGEGLSEEWLRALGFLAAQKETLMSALPSQGQL